MSLLPTSHCTFGTLRGARMQDSTPTPHIFYGFATPSACTEGTPNIWGAPFFPGTYGESIPGSHSVGTIHHGAWHCSLFHAKQCCRAQWQLGRGAQMPPTSQRGHSFPLIYGWETDGCGGVLPAVGVTWEGGVPVGKQVEAEHLGTSLCLQGGFPQFIKSSPWGYASPSEALIKCLINPTWIGVGRGGSSYLGALIGCQGCFNTKQGVSHPPDVVCQTSLPSCVGLELPEGIHSSCSQQP